MIKNSISIIGACDFVKLFNQTNAKSVASLTKRDELQYGSFLTIIEDVYIMFETVDKVHLLPRLLYIDGTHNHEFHNLNLSVVTFDQKKQVVLLGLIISQTENAESIEKLLNKMKGRMK